jgi:hypothetical protein
VTRLALAAALACLLAALVPSVAAADGDPASDVLFTSGVFLPYSPPSKANSDALKAAVTRAQKSGYKVKVAVIASEVDLGSVPQAFNKPQQYANFLAGELRTLYGPKARTGLLIVMPAGIGISGKPYSAAERRAVRTVNIDGGANSDQLVKAATTALERMAAAAGHPIGKASEDSGGSSGAAVAAIVLVALLLVAGGLGLALRMRRGAAAKSGDTGGPDTGDTARPDAG